MSRVEFQTRENAETAEIQSLCMNCREQGTTRLLLTSIPFFREIVLMAFECPECGYRSSEVQTGHAIAEKAQHFELAVGSKADLNREVVKSDRAVVTIPEIELEIPAASGSLNTIEGTLSAVVADIEAGQPLRRATDPENYAKLEEFLRKVNRCLTLETPFTFILDDLTGNSHIQNLFAPNPDPRLKFQLVARTLQQDIDLGIVPADEAKRDEMIAAAAAETRAAKAGAKMPREIQLPTEMRPDEVLTLPADCYACGAPGETRVFSVNIPFFKDTILWGFTCNVCGYKSVEVKSGGGMAPKGQKITLRCEDAKDLTRDFLKSEHAGITIPELDFELSHGTLGGKFTTIEGILKDAHSHIRDANPFGFGDSADRADRVTLASFLDKLQQLSEGRVFPFTIIVDDPTSNSFIAPNDGVTPETDPRLHIESYTRSFEQDEELGLNDMNTDDY